MSMLFDTPGLSIPSNSKPLATPSAAALSKKRKRKSDSGPSPSSKAPLSKEASVEVNLDKLMKRMRKMEKDSGWGGELGAGGKSGVEQAEKDESKAKAKAKAKAKKSEAKEGGLPVVGGAGEGKKGGKGEGASASSPAPKKEKPTRFEPAKKPKKAKNKKDDTAFSPASSANMSALPPRHQADPSPAKPSARHAAPTDEDASEATSAAPQTATQSALRAKLAGGKFRMLNETLYTSTGEEAWVTMKEEGAFDDYHAGFRGQASHWPVHPLALLTTSLSALPPLSLIADFGCGDAALARALVPKDLKVISFDLVSKDGWVIEAECSSVPLPGGRAGGQIVDCVVCCLSLMGTDWVEMVREARRILKEGGQLKIAEVTSRFTNVDAFVALIEFIGFKKTHKDTTNTHFIMFDFVKTAGAEEPISRAETTKKAAALLTACVYKRR